MALDIFASGIDPQDVDFQNCDSGGSPDVGVYHATLFKEAFVDEPNKNPAQSLSFRIKAGTTAGQAGKEISLYLPAGSDDPDKHINMIKRMMGVAKRLGVYTEKMALAKEPIPFENAVGKDAIIEVELHNYEDKQTGEQKTTHRISYMGVWSLDHPDAPECPRAGKPGVKPAPAITGKAGATANGKVEPAKPATSKPTAKPTTKPAPSAADRDEV